MKTVSGKIVSPPSDVSLPKAAKILSKFISEDYGASPAFLHYLQRASEAFDELVHLHMELRGSSSSPSSRNRRKPARNHDEVEGPAGGDEMYRFNSIDVGVKKEGEEGSLESGRRKKTKNESDGVTVSKKRKKSSEEIGVDSGVQSKKRKKVKSQVDD